MIPAFVINLERRPERLERFKAGMQALAPLLSLERLPAVDGGKLRLEGELLARIEPWNLEHLPEKQLRGVVGCALSHLAAWERIAALPVSHALVFEDDAVPVDPARVFGQLSRLLARLPPDTDLLWLNDWDRARDGGRAAALAHRLRRRRDRLWRLLGSSGLRAWNTRIEKTTEAYLLTPALAAALHAALAPRLGAVDHHMLLYFRSRPGLRLLECRAAPFRQRDRNDTDIQQG